MASIFTSQTPVNANANDGNPIATGTKFTVSTAGTISAVRFFAPTNAVTTSTFTGSIWSCTNQTAASLLRSGSLSGAGFTPGAWNVVPLSSPIAVSPGTTYQTVIHNNTGNYVATGGFFTSSPLVNGPLTAIRDLGTPFQNGSFEYSAVAATYPTQFFNGGCYFVDVIFTADTPDFSGTGDFSWHQTLAASGTAEASGTGALSLHLQLDASGQASGQLLLDPLAELYQAALACLCSITSEMPGAPEHCAPRIGPEITYDMGQYADYCCEGLAYISLGDLWVSDDSFPEQDIIRQVRGNCPPAFWAVDLKLGIIRCSPTGSETGEPPTDDEWTAAAIQNLYDAQALRRVACCIRDWVSDNTGLYLGMSVVINRQTQVTPNGGCVERYFTVTLQFPNLDCVC
jgi:hypothetical protein